jgi:hypothetical protein
MIKEQMAEEVLLWWRTDELHQSKPTVLNEVDYTLHYFEEVLFQAIPLLHEYLSRSLKKAFPQRRATAGRILQLRLVGRRGSGWQPFRHRRCYLANGSLSAQPHPGQVHRIGEGSHQNPEHFPALGGCGQPTAGCP